MLNVTILACLLILTGCLGFNDDDVIDDAQGDDTDSGSTTIMNAYPPVQHYNGIGNGTLTVPAGSTIEVLEIWGTSISYVEPVPTTFHLGNDMPIANGSINCATMQYNATFESGWWPSDGGACTYSFTSTDTMYLNEDGQSIDPYSVDMPFSIVYRVWS